jgi:hypothetical protein
MKACRAAWASTFLMRRPSLAIVTCFGLAKMIFTDPIG